MSPERFAIAQVSPYVWEAPHEVNRFLRRLSEELAGRGHRVAIVAPSSSRTLVRASRATVARLGEEPGALFEAGAGAGVAVFGAGPAIAPSRKRRGTVSLPIDVARTIEALLEGAALDLVHVHEPFAPSASSAALRHSRALNVGTFHAASERTLSAQMGRRMARLLLGRLDGRVASSEATRALMEKAFPAHYRIVRPGAEVLERAGPAEEGAPVEILYSAREERAALRRFLRSLRRLPQGLSWRATVWLPEGIASSPPVARAIRGRVRLVGSEERPEAELLARADIVVAASRGIAPAPGVVLSALGAGAVPVAARLPEYEELLGAEERGLLFEPRDADGLTGALAQLVKDVELRERLRAECGGRELSWERVADEYEALYAELAARRHRPSEPSVRRRLGGRALIDVDLHMHTDHSPDCATPVDTLLETARARGLGAIAVTDHNEISGALEARERASGVKVIVAEEVKTAGQGEVIGLFIEEKISRGMTLEETIAEIHRQGGLAYVPHPFDRMHSVPDYEHLLGVVEELDAIEVFNARVAFSSFNDEAARFAAKYRIAAGAGSDSHVAQGLGSVRISMRDFDGPEEFLASLREADIVRGRQSYLYVQALKFIQTRGKAPRPAPSNS